MRVSAKSHVGLVRPVNEDRWCVERVGRAGAGVLLAVADGLGGAEAGEVASETAISVLRSRLAEDWDPAATDPVAALSGAVAAANAAIHRLAAGDPGRQGMGTTLTAALVVADRMWLAHVGDSRAYLLRDGAIERLTADHSLVGEMLAAGRLTEEEAMVHPQRFILTNALGTAAEAHVDFATRTVRPRDVLVLCSDGLSNLVPSAEIRARVEQARDAGFDRIADDLVGLAIARGGHDNVTVVVAEFGSTLGE